MICICFKSFDKLMRNWYNGHVVSLLSIQAIAGVSPEESPGSKGQRAG